MNQADAVTINALERLGIGVSYSERVSGSDPFYGEIPGLQGVLAIGRTLEECREELRGALEVWILLGVHFGTPIPVVDGIDLNELFVPSQEAA
ncbi:MAG: type II toxin-antitoxin system HicB family antitoxin [Roseiflexaceae bacterium]|nr:type II toxin-antitoxin system HicB family antitoxin [Roseiflexaceae bacterium]